MILAAQPYKHAISTHSLTRRLTLLPLRNLLNKNHFNSQPHKEADGKDSLSQNGSVYFNSQPHKEADSDGE